MARFRFKKRLTPTLVARIIIATALTLTLLSSIIQPGLASSHHLCTMACCLGKPPHEAGSCSVAFLAEEEPEASGDQEQDHSLHGHMQHSDAHGSSSNKGISQTARLTP